MRMNKSTGGLLIVLMAFSCVWQSAVAEDEIELEGFSIIGNRELPKTITIVPWKKALPGESLGRPNNSVLNNILQPIDREVFIRELGYYRQVNPLPANQKKRAASTD